MLAYVSPFVISNPHHSAGPISPESGLFGLALFLIMIGLLVWMIIETFR